MSKTISGECCSGGGGGGGGATNIVGGAAGQVLYQNAGSSTTFTNAADGVLQSNGTTPSFSALSLSGSRVTGVLPLTKGGTGSSTLTGVTGTGNIVASISPTLVSPNIGDAGGQALTLSDTGDTIALTCANNDLAAYNLSTYNTAGIANTNFFVGHGNAGTPSVGSMVNQRGVMWTDGNYPIDIVPNNESCLTAKTDGKLKFYKYPSTNFLYTDSDGVVVSGIAPKFRASLGANQPIIANTLTLVAIDLVDFDTTSAFNVTTYRYTPLVAGYYQFSASLGPSFPTTAGAVEVSLWRDGAGGLTLFAAQGYHSQNNPDFDVHQNCSGLIYMNGTNNYVRMFVKVSVTQTLPAGNTFISGTLIA